MSAMSAIVPLSLFLVSVSPIAAELEPEDGCLLQKTNERQLLTKEEQGPVPGYILLCGPRCRCAFPETLKEGPTNAVECAAACPTSSATSWLGFTFDPTGPECRCCDNLDIVSPVNKNFYLYAFTGEVVGDPHIHTSLLWMANTTLFSARVPFPCGISQAWRRSCIQKKLEPRNSQSIGKCTCTIRATNPSRRACF